MTLTITTPNIPRARTFEVEPSGPDLLIFSDRTSLPFSGYIPSGAV
jgi:hypothetical protein